MYRISPGVSLVIDVLAMVLVTSPLLFLVAEAARTDKRYVRYWLLGTGMLALNQLLSFEFFRGGIPVALRMGLNNAAYFAIAACYLERFVKQRRALRTLLISGAVSGGALFLVALMQQAAGMSTDLALILQQGWTYAFTVFAFRLFAHTGALEGRMRFYATHLLLAAAFTLHSEIFIAQLLRILCTLGAYTFLAVYMGTMAYDTMGWLEYKWRNLMHVRDVIISVMHDIGTEIKSVSEVDQTLEVILKKAMNVLTAQAGVIYLIDPADGKLAAVVVQGYFPPLYKMSDYATTRKEHIARLMKKHKISPGEGLIGQVVQDGKSVLIENGHLDDRITEYGKGASNINTLMASPLRIKDDLLGVIAVVNKAGDESFDDMDMGLFSSLAMQAAVTLNNARMYANLAEQERIKREVEFAKRIQQNLLPKKIPAVNGIQLAGQMFPALEVSGDYYDFIKRTDDRVNIIIGDVSGKGIPAGMIMLMVRTVLHAISDSFQSTKEVICEATRLMMPNLNPGEFMTLIYLDWDNASGTMTYTSAGHEHIVIHRAATKKCETIMSGGIAVGMYEEIADFVEEKKLTDMQEGDIMVLYTDGITEALNSTGEMYGLDRLMAVVDAHPEKTADELKGVIYDDIMAFIGNTPQHDDITMVVMKIGDAPAAVETGEAAAATEDAVPDEADGSAPGEASGSDA